MSITPEKALEELLAEGHFVRRQDGWAYAAKPPSKKDLDWYVSCVRTLSAWSIGDNPRVRVTCGEGAFGIMWKLTREEIPFHTPVRPAKAPAASMVTPRIGEGPGASQEMGVIICCDRCGHRCHGKRNVCGAGTEMGGCGCMGCACEDCASIPGVEK